MTDFIVDPNLCPHGRAVGVTCGSGLCGDASGTGVVVGGDLILNQILATAERLTRMSPLPVRFDVSPGSWLALRAMAPVPASADTVSIVDMLWGVPVREDTALPDGVVRVTWSDGTVEVRGAAHV